MENYDVSIVLGTGSFAQVYRVRDSQTKSRVALKFLIVDRVLDSKRRKQKEQEGEGGNWLDKDTAMNYGRSVSPSASSRRHLGKVNDERLTETTATDLRGGGVDVIDTYRFNDLDQHQLWRIMISAHSWLQGPFPKFNK